MIYRKEGIIDRWENGTLVHVQESGVAVEGDVFECYPAPSSEGRRSTDAAQPQPNSGEDISPSPRRGELPQVARAIHDLIPPGVAVERLILTEGVADHEYDDRTWREESRRLHLSLTRDRIRALVDLASFDLSPVATIANALSRLTSERPAPPRLRLAPNVTAALIPMLLSLAPPNIRLVQTATGIDGKGNLVEEAAGDWPNWYRPSYRVPPMRVPLHLRIECDVTEIDAGRPIAVALLASVHGPVLRVLVDDGSSAYPATVRIARIDAVASERVWYPYGAGSFGAEMML